MENENPKSICQEHKEKIKEAIEESVFRFCLFFSKNLLSVRDDLRGAVRIDSHGSFESIPNGPGFYVILTNHRSEKNDNKCTFEKDGLKAIYRGQTSKLKERLQGHLDNERYQATKIEKKQEFWSRCMKMEGSGEKGGVNVITEAKYSADWMVLYLRLPDSHTSVRETVEWAFDIMFQRPIYSNETKRLDSNTKANVIQRLKLEGVEVAL